MMMHSKNDLLLKADNLNLEFQNKRILRDINFEIHNIVRPNVTQGQVVSLIGRSGIGKTQLFKILSGLKNPTSGQVLVHKEQRQVQAGDMGVVPQNYYLFEWRKVRKILELAIRKNPRIKKVDYKDVIEKNARDFGLEEQLDKYPMQLSGGQRQRVSILQQLINGSNFLLLDEPFSGLDAVSIAQVTKVLQKVSLSDEINTIIIVSHDLANSLALSDSALILTKEQGKEGATITHTIDLIEQGLAWQPDIKQKSVFQKLVSDIEKMI
jgi:ABC-type nitrate/sulfonate/bicarbonate transport system ATPase subunit